QEFLAPLESSDRAGVDDRCAWLHVRNRRAGQEEVAEDVRPEGALELFVGDRFDRRLMLLERGVIHQDVEPAERGDGLPNGAPTERRASDVARNERAPSAFGLDGGPG